MISVNEAREIIAQHSFVLPPVKSPLAAAAGKVLADDIYATTDIPAYAQSSMDGYAIAFSNWQPGKPLPIMGEMAAGAKQIETLEAGTATRIFTGAPLPAGADTVVMQEKTSVQNGQLLITDEKLQAGNNVRAAGSEITKGSLAMAANSYLGPASIGFLAGIGVAELNIYDTPAISLIITGNELQQPGQVLQYGQVYESNSYTLSAVLKTYGMQFAKVYHAEDKPEAVTAALQQALTDSDMVLFTGGISVGDYDYVLQAVTATGVQQLFHKVKQRPGKPLYFGKKENKLVFGLPGNPSSVLTCFYQYVAPALEKMSHRENRMPVMSAALANSYRKPAGITHFLKGFFDGMSVTILEAQESYRMHSFAQANCLVQVNEEQVECHTGEMMKIHLFQS